MHINKNATTDVDNRRPTCKVNIKLFNGDIVSENFNLSQTLKDIINFVRKKVELIILFTWLSSI